MFRCFWNWMSSPVGMRIGVGGQGKGRRRKVSKAEEKRRKRQRRRRLLAERKRHQREQEMSREDIERNKILLRETFRRLNGYYETKKTE